MYADDYCFIATLPCKIYFMYAVSFSIIIQMFLILRNLSVSSFFQITVLQTLCQSNCAKKKNGTLIIYYTIIEHLG